MINKPYVYLVGWKDLNKWYIGSKTGKNAYPELFWKNYKTSSKEVKKLILTNGDPDVIEVRKIFLKNESALIWESKLIRRLGAIYLDKWLNKTTGGMLKFIKAFTKSGKSLIVSPDDPKLLSGEINHYNKGYGIYKKISGEYIRCTKTEAEKNNYDGITKNTKNGFLGKKHSDETRKKMSGPRPNMKPWNKGKKVNYSKTWYDSIEKRDYSGNNNPQSGKRWLKNDGLLLKVYLSDIIIIDKLLLNGWIFGTSVKIKYENVTKKIGLYI